MVRVWTGLIQMSKDTTKDRDAQGWIELDPTGKQIPLPAHNETHHDSPRGRDGDYGAPIPMHPLHLCPTCDYILTGLKSRRCPECGTPFGLIEARRHGAQQSPRARRDMRALKWARISTYLGEALFLAGMITPMIVFRSTGAHWGLWMTAAAVLIGSLAALYKGFFQRSLADAILLAGIAMATLSSVLLIIF